MVDRVDLPEWLVPVLEAVELATVAIVFVALPVTAVVAQVVMACA